MAIAFFSSLPKVDIVEVSFALIQGGETTIRLLADSGFTGDSSFLISKNARDVGLMPAPSLGAIGAIQGMQEHVLVFCRVPALNFHAIAVSILADVSSLDLPSGVHGLASLHFFRQFRRWGSEKMDDGSWRFFLET